MRVQSVRVATNLQRFGCVRGKRIFVFIGNAVEVAPLVFGAIYLGCPLMPIITCVSQAECEFYVKLTKPDFVVCHVKFYNMLSKCFENLEMHATFFTVDGQTDDSVAVQRLFEPVENESNYE